MTLLTFVLAAPPPDQWHHGAPWLIVPLFFGLWLLAGGAAALLLLTRGFNMLRSRDRHGLDRALDILAERFASGELSADEYHARIAQLR